MPGYVIRVIDSAAVPTIVVRRRVAAAQLSLVVPAACGTVWAFIRANALRAGRNVALYSSDAIDLEAGAEALSPFTPTADIVRSELPAGRVVTTTHLGPYGELGAAYRAMDEFCQRHGLSPKGPSWEVYGHWQESWNADPSKIETQIFRLLEPAPAS